MGWLKCPWFQSAGRNGTVEREELARWCEIPAEMRGGRMGWETGTRVRTGQDLSDNKNYGTCHSLYFKLNPRLPGNILHPEQRNKVLSPKFRTPSCNVMPLVAPSPP